tara:strand:- start:2409 stop:2792 length:384 start_codon:yes stop_codon:yes gene_type:complete
MLISTPISLGELLDKISILQIKERKINDNEKLILIKEELEFLTQALDKHIDKIKIQTYLDQLLEVNSKLWDIEDKIRDHERNKKFDQEFIDKARSVYFTNDKRSEIKLNINKEFGSKIIEVKSYEKY